MNTAQDSSPPGDYYCATCEKHFAAGGRCPDDGTRLVKLATRIDPLLGRDLDGRYTVIEKLGQGGMGAVYRSDQHAVGRDVAIKVVNAQLVSDPEVLRRFLREAKLASRLNHPNAVSVLDFSQTDDGLLYLVMELVAGRTLDQVIKSEKILSPERVVRIGAQICDALEAAHTLSIIHRDLKPANIMLMGSARDFVKVLDFGLAKSISPDQTSTTMTGSGALLGTPAFMPPELAKGLPCDHRADLYSLGCVLYLAGSGRLPFHADSAHEMIALHGGGVPPPMTDVPPALAAVIDRLLAKAPGDRFPTAAAVREALEASIDPARDGRYLGDTTNPSLGPFPATASQFDHLKSTPQVVGRKPPRPSELQRLMSQDTLHAGGLAAVKEAVPATALSGAGHQPRARWPWIVAPVAIAAIIGIGIVTTHKSPQPAAAPPADAASSIDRTATPPVDAAPPPDAAIDAPPAPADAAAIAPPHRVPSGSAKRPPPVVPPVTPPPATGSAEKPLPF